MVSFIQNLIGNDLIATLIMSFFPMIELKGGIIFARGIGFGFFKSFALAYLGSTLIFFPIYFLLTPILNLLKKIKWFNNLALKIENYFSKKSADLLLKQRKINKVRDERFLKMLAVFIFVAIPLPLTGIWAGTGVAVFLNLKFKDAILPIVLGNLVSGTLISLLASLCVAVWDLESLNYVLWILFGIALILFVLTLIKISASKPDKKEE